MTRPAVWLLLGVLGQTSAAYAQVPQPTPTPNVDWSQVIQTDNRGDRRYIHFHAGDPRECLLNLCPQGGPHPMVRFENGDCVCHP